MTPDQWDKVVCYVCAVIAVLAVVFFTGLN
jgi:hypothetical protein